MALRKAIAWSVSGQFISVAILFGASVVVARLLTPHDMGVYAIAMAILAILNTLASFGIGTYLVRATELHRSTLDSGFTLNAIFAIGYASIILGISLIEERLLQNAAVGEVLLPLVLLPLIGIIEFRPITMLQREMNFRALALINLGKAVISTVVMIGLALEGFSYMSLAYANLVAVAFSATCVNVIAGHHAGFRLSLSEGRQMVVFGSRMIMIGGVNTVAARLSDIILGNLLGLAALGLYSRATSISSQIFENVYGAVTRVLFVQLSADFRERGVLRDVFLRGFEMITALIWPLLIGLAVLSGPAVYILFGERWLGAARPLSLLLVAQFVVISFGMNWELFVLRDETAKQARFEAVRAVVGVFTFTCGCFFNISAAAVGRIAEALFGLALYHPHMNRMADTRPGEMMQIYIRGFSLTAAAVLPSLILMISTGWSHTTSLVLIFSAVILGVLLWLILLHVQRHPLFAELKILGGKVLFWRKGIVNAAL